MLLYHGSNVAVEKPLLIPARRLLDFGAGFYLTSDMEQAKNWAIHTEKNRKGGNAIVSRYKIDERQMKKLKLLVFKKPNKKWFRYVCANRKGMAKAEKYDIVIGPVADDQTIRTINNYFSGYFSEKIALQLLLPQRLKNQYTFKTEKALEFLLFEEALVV